MPTGRAGLPTVQEHLSRRFFHCDSSSCRGAVTVTATATATATVTVTVTATTTATATATVLVLVHLPSQLVRLKMPAATTRRNDMTLQRLTRSARHS